MSFIKSISNELEYVFFLCQNENLFDELSIPPSKSIIDLFTQYHDNHENIIFGLQSSARNYKQRRVLHNIEGNYLNFSNINERDKIFLLEQLSNLVLKQENGNKFVSILDISGLSASKSSNFYNIEKFSNALYTEDDVEFPDYGIKFKDINDLNININHIKQHCPKIIPLYHQVWNNQSILGIPGGSHHIAAVYRQCKEQNLNHFLNTSISTQMLNISVAREICEKYYVLLKFEPLQKFSWQTKENQSCKNLDTTLNKLNAKIKYASIQYHQFNFYFFPKSKISKYIYNKLIQYDKYIFDYNENLNTLIQSQESHKCNICKSIQDGDEIWN